MKILRRERQRRNNLFMTAHTAAISTRENSVSIIGNVLLLVVVLLSEALRNLL